MPATVLPPGRSRALGQPADASPCPARAPGHRGSGPNRAPNPPPRSQRQPATPTGPRTPAALDTPQGAPPLASHAGIPPGEGGPRRQARLRGHGGRAPAGVGPGEARLGRGRPAQGPAGSGARPAAARRLRRHPPRTAACLPACLPGAARRAASQGRRGSRRVGSQPGERPRAQPGPLSGWPSGLRRCVQVAVSPGGVGSNPTPDKPAFWPAGQTHPSSRRHCLSPHTPSPRYLHPTPGTFSPPQRIFPPKMAEAAAADFLTATCPPPPKHAHPRSHPRPPTPIHAHGRAPARPGPRRLKQPRGGWQAFFASPALRPLPGERPTRCRSLASTSAAAALPLDGILSSPPAPPARLRSTATGRQPSPRLALAGLHLPGARPARVPPSLLAGQRTPTFLARVRPGKRAPLGRERKPCVPVQPTHRRPAGAPDLGATAPVTGGRRCPGRSQARLGVVPASAGSPRAGSRSAKGPLLTTTTLSEPDPGSAVGQSAGARLTRFWVPGHERRSGGGGSAAEGLQGVALPLSRFAHSPSPASRPPPALARPTPARPESQHARGTLGREPTRRKTVCARPQRQHSACT
ncbi:basic proline-rich protein-like [Bos indicus x Bos taurus]|uniref:basic proline-rich protein-like n=1 Tax=Bos indicus x Bos taurus TaxID=30522 RepID=UPI000F7D24D7|nr:basic proline-rich protein-like [Bos indicus x Bos taurus]